MIYTVTMNPSLDQHMYLPKTKEGETNYADRVERIAGGKGINVSKMLANLRMESVAVSVLGGFSGQEIQRQCTAEGIRTLPVYLKEGESRVNIKIHAQHETEINERGPAHEPAVTSRLKKFLATLKEGDILVLAGKGLSDTPDTFYRELMETVKGKGVRCAVDAQKDLLKNTFALKPYVIKPNLSELEELLGQKITAADEIKEAGLRLVEQGCENVIISLGNKGAVLINKDEQFWMPACQGKVISTTGSGDSLLAGFLYKKESGGSNSDALAYGVCCGSASAFTAGLALKEDVEELYGAYRQECGIL